MDIKFQQKIKHIENHSINNDKQFKFSKLSNSILNQFLYDITVDTIK